jgi:uncharacterized membrane protein YhaH (DUF805 family)
MRYGRTFQVVAQMTKIMMMVVIAMVMIKCLGLEKKKGKNKIGSRQR